MKKILLSLAVIGIVSAVVVGGTSAWFSDTEEITGNTFSTGSIDINVDKGEAEEIERFVFEDMKPGQTEYMEFTINNTGANSANIWKKIVVTTPYNDSNHPADKPITEPECVYGEGTWSEDNGGSCSGDYTPQYNLEDYIKYDLSVKVYAPNGNAPIWWQTIYVDGDNKVISDVYGTSTTPIYDPAKGVILGMIPVGGKMEVKQSYHLDENVTNWAQ
ncbi:MAG: TasA family protein, partial [Candidatus Pacebacteria bacterium]|nr:TasA family protein [Candidatus Paceibacterota bacterium]